VASIRPEVRTLRLISSVIVGFIFGHVARAVVPVADQTAFLATTGVGSL
jgi:uncharacterized membrane protein YeaQ/YmgE (transglycosylase-associated protein family)